MRHHPRRPQTAVEALKRLPMVADASLSWSVAGRKDNSQGWVFHSADGDEVAPRTLFATAGYCNTMGIKIIRSRLINFQLFVLIISG